VGAKTIHPHGGVRLEYRSRSFLSWEGTVVSKAARKGLGGGRCIGREIITHTESTKGNHPAGISGRIPTCGGPKED
jgi:hypothetical protein